MQSFALLTLAAAALVQAAPAAPGHVDVVTGTACTCLCLVINTDANLMV